MVKLLTDERDLRTTESKQMWTSEKRLPIIILNPVLKYLYLSMARDTLLSNPTWCPVAWQSSSLWNEEKNDDINI